MQPIVLCLFIQTIDEETARDLMSHKGQKVYNYSIKFKIAAIEYAEINGNRAAEK